MALPGLAGTDHVGFTVPDLEAAEHFLVDIIGCERIYSLGPYEPNGDWMSRQLGVDDATRIPRLRFYRCATGVNFEVFEYETPEEQSPQPRNSDIGGHHLAFYVDDIEVAVEYLRANDVEVMGEIVSSGAASEGQRWIYFRAPWGMQFELVSFPSGKAYERTASRLLWDVRRPDA